MFLKIIIGSEKNRILVKFHLKILNALLFLIFFKQIKFFKNF